MHLYSSPSQLHTYALVLLFYIGHAAVDHHSCSSSLQDFLIFKARQHNYLPCSFAFLSYIELCFPKIWLILIQTICLLTRAEKNEWNAKVSQAKIKGDGPYGTRIEETKWEKASTYLEEKDKRPNPTDAYKF